MKEDFTYQYHVAARFDSIAESHSGAPALRLMDGTTCSFEDLRRQSLAIAHALMEKGVVREDVVALLHDKSTSGFAVMLACLRIGAIYVNLDPESPPERIRRILDCCQPKLVVNVFPDDSPPPVLASLAETAATAICHREELFNSEAGDPEKEINVVGLTSDSPAYIMFTSGSTGYPKGAVITHGSLIRFADWARETFQITPDDVLTNVNPIYFDNSVFDFYASIFNGASLFPVETALAKDPKRLVEAVGVAACTIWFSVPSLLVYLLTTRVLKAESFPTVRKIIFGGEGFPKTKLKQLYELFSNRADLENVYGPTEATCICSCHTVEDSDFEDMTAFTTLGYLAPNFGYEIIPQDGNEDLGELFLTGPQVGFGYYNDPERSKTAFVQNPSHNRFREIGYRTGDLVERAHDGRLYFKGRVDFQIKHMGYRIELEEIEAAMNQVPGVHEAAALYHSLGDGLGMIVGFVAVEDGIEVSNIEGALPEFLPSYMLPRKIEIRSQLPKNANGKIDRVALQSEL